MQNYGDVSDGEEEQELMDDEQSVECGGDPVGPVGGGGNAGPGIGMGMEMPGSGVEKQAEQRTKKDPTEVKERNAKQHKLIERSEYILPTYLCHSWL